MAWGPGTTQASSSSSSSSAAAAAATRLTPRRDVWKQSATRLRRGAHLEVVLLGLAPQQHVEGGVHVLARIAAQVVHVQLVLRRVQRQHERAVVSHRRLHVLGLHSAWQREQAHSTRSCRQVGPEGPQRGAHTDRAKRGA
eukprot:scaffold916_cov516-Prasinococcus_capsulatus_cf.AAC.2